MIILEQISKAIVSFITPYFPVTPKKNESWLLHWNKCNYLKITVICPEGGNVVKTILMLCNYQDWERPVWVCYSQMHLILPNKKKTNDRTKEVNKMK